jgi:hypothetical protein
LTAKIKKIEHINILGGGSEQIAFPFLVRLDHGPVAMLYRRAPFAKDTGQKHVHRESRAAMLVSNDPAIWQSADKIDVPGGESAGHAPAMFPIGGNRYMFLDWRWAFHTEEDKPKESFREDSQHCWVGLDGAFSREAACDKGKWSFGPEQKIIAAGHPVIFTGASALRRGENEYLVPAWQWEYNWYIDNENFLLRTTDGGAAWEQVGRIEKRAREFAALRETAVIETGAPEKLLAMLRTTNIFDYMLASHSEDAGLTWTPPEKTNIQGHPPHLVNLGGETILCTYANPFKHRSVRLCLSTDGGKTWDAANSIELRGGFPDPDFGCPFTLPLDGNRFLTAYYLKDEKQEYHIQAELYELEI